jgi:DNA ligase-1
MGGSEVFHTEIVETNQSGRTLTEQIELRTKSRISRMKDRGYKSTIEEANSSSNTNQLGLLRPQLAQPKERVKNPDMHGAVLQKKLDGHRCMITKQDGVVIAYSRQGKLIPSIKEHILSYLSDILPEGVTIDGELYCHGMSLQSIASLVKRKQPDTVKINFVAYDLVSEETYRDRHSELVSVLKAVDCKSIIVLPYREYTNEYDMYEYLAKVRAQGFEGLMLKLAGFEYQEGRRSNGTIKIKVFEDAEFEVIDVFPSAIGTGVCVCKLDENRSFSVTAPGTNEQKTEILENKHKYIGKYLKCQFANYTDEGVPFQPVALHWYIEI